MWLWALAHGCRIGLLLCDTAGAFDRVDSSIVLRKCREAGVCDAFLNLFEDFFSPRQAVVVVNGVRSAINVLFDQVYQGIVFCPPIWNVFFKDVSLPVTQSGEVDSKFADDLTAFKAFPASTDNNTVLEQLGKVCSLMGPLQ
jgi:hypothetical protein